MTIREIKTEKEVLSLFFVSYEQENMIAQYRSQSTPGDMVYLLRKLKT